MSRAAVIALGAVYYVLVGVYFVFYAVFAAGRSNWTAARAAVRRSFGR